MQKGILARMNISQKLTGSFLALALIPVLIVTALSMKTMYEDRLEEINQHNAYVAQMKAGSLTSLMMQQVQMMGMLSYSLEAQSMDPQQLVPLLQNGISHSPGLSGIFVCDLTGQQIARDSGNYVNVGDRDYIKAVLQQGRDYAFSDALVSKSSGKVVVIAAVPIKNDAGAVIGTMASTINMDTLSQQFFENTNNLADRQEILYLVDSQGNVMLHPEEKYTSELTSWKAMAPVASALTGQTAATEYLNGDGIECLAASAPASSLGWSVVVENTRQDVMAVLYRTLGTIALIVAVLLLLIIAFARYLSGSFAAPMRQLADQAHRLAKGDLTVRLHSDSDDEIGQAARSFNEMSISLDEVMQQISLAANQVAAGSKNISDAGNMLAKGASSQAASVEELSTSIAEISSQTKGNAANALQADTLARESHTKAALGNEQMEKMLHAMEDINTSSANIAKIIKVIDEIAFQTNILALNAAVEAARAGQQGKGFAVVAEEVRSLAARSAQAAKSTTEIIQESIAKVKAGTLLAQDTAQALHSIQASIDQVSELIAGIAKASDEQNSALQMLNQGVLQVSNVVQTNSSTAQESAAASVELSAQAELLQDAVGRFKV